MAAASVSRRLHFQAMPDSLFLLLAEEAFCKGLHRLSALLEDLLLDRQAEQPESSGDPALARILPF